MPYHYGNAWYLCEYDGGLFRGVCPLHCGFSLSSGQFLRRFGIAPADPLAENRDKAGFEKGKMVPHLIFGDCAADVRKKEPTGRKLAFLIILFIVKGEGFMYNQNM